MPFSARKKSDAAPLPLATRDAIVVPFPAFRNLAGRPPASGPFAEQDACGLVIVAERSAPPAVGWTLVPGTAEFSHRQFLCPSESSRQTLDRLVGLATTPATAPPSDSGDCCWVYAGALSAHHGHLLVHSLCRFPGIMAWSERQTTQRPPWGKKIRLLFVDYICMPLPRDDERDRALRLVPLQEIADRRQPSVFGSWPDGVRAALSALGLGLEDAYLARGDTPILFPELLIPPSMLPPFVSHADDQALAREDARLSGLNPTLRARFFGTLLPANCSPRPSPPPASGEGEGGETTGLWWASRRGCGSKRVSNEEEAELALERELGFRVVRLHELPGGFGAQVAFVRHRVRVLAGFCGTNMHNSLFLGPGAACVAVGTPRNPERHEEQEWCCGSSGSRSGVDSAADAFPTLHFVPWVSAETENPRGCGGVSSGEEESVAARCTRIDVDHLIRAMRALLSSLNLKGRTNNAPVDETNF